MKSGSLHEVGEPAAGVGEDDVQVVPHEDERVDGDVVLLLRGGERIDEELDHRCARLEVEAPVEAAPREKARRGGDDAARQGHALDPARAEPVAGVRLYAGKGAAGGGGGGAWRRISPTRVGASAHRGRIDGCVVPDTATGFAGRARIV